ncbi:MAG: hypothetical protein LBB21_00600 [Holosporaceae bacterium]|jgi:hypothetical protein|nr:hypothetical protein [Holosporaceae bacterium]
MSLLVATGDVAVTSLSYAGVVSPFVSIGAPVLSLLFLVGSNAYDYYKFRKSEKKIAVGNVIGSELEVFKDWFCDIS